MDSLSKALTSELRIHLRDELTHPGVWAGFDPAETSDRSAFFVLAKETPTIDNPNPTLKCRMKRDLTINPDGIKNVTYLNQAREIIELDKRYHFSKITVDITSHKAVFEYLQEYFGPRIEGVIFTLPLKRDMIQAFRVVLQEKLIEFNPDHQYHKIFRRELYELDPRTLKHPDRGSDDFVWAGALAIKSTDVVHFKSGVESGYSSEELIF
jgi:hypothetical protein